MLLSSKPGIVEVEPTRLFGRDKTQRTPQEPLEEGDEGDGDGGGVPVYFSNPDLLWKTQHPFPRFGQGAFRIALEAVYKARLEALGLLRSDDQEEKEEEETRGGKGKGKGGKGTTDDDDDAQSSLEEGCRGHEATPPAAAAARRSFEYFVQKWKQYGKPEVAQFMHAQEAIEAQLRRGRPCNGNDNEAEEENNDGGGGGDLGRLAVSHYYMVGDNPASDMAGARNMMRAHAAPREEEGEEEGGGGAPCSDEPCPPPEEEAAAASTTTAYKKAKPGYGYWSGILVCTGVYSGGAANIGRSEDKEASSAHGQGGQGRQGHQAVSTGGAAWVVEDVAAAVEVVLREHGAEH